MAEGIPATLKETTADCSTPGSTVRNFLILGIAGFVAPRHVKAVYDTGNRLVAALDLHDSVGLLDTYFPDARFFTELDLLIPFVEGLQSREEHERVHYMSICTPSYLHTAHVHLALTTGMNAVCEKPLAIDPQQLDILSDLERTTGRRVYTIHQLRLHPNVIALKDALTPSPRDHRFTVSLTYVTPRGRWYDASWKGSPAKSGGLAMNIGIHLFDVLLWLFGPVKRSVVHIQEDRRLAGELELETADVTWFLSIDFADLPDRGLSMGTSSARSIVVDGTELNFSDGFGDLHTAMYRNIISGAGIGIEEVRPSIQLAYDIENSVASQPRSVVEV